MSAFDAIPIQTERLNLRLMAPDDAEFQRPIHLKPGAETAKLYAERNA